MTWIISKSCNITKDPDQSPNPYLRPLRTKKKKSSKNPNSPTADAAVIVTISYRQPAEEK